MTQSGDDATIIRRIQAGEPELFSGLYERYIDEIFRFVHWRMKHRETAEDVTSQIFMKALEHIYDFDVAGAGFRPWLYRVARNTITDHWRVKRDHIDISEVDVKSDDDVAGMTDVKNKIKEVEKYLSKLDDVQRDVVVLRAWEGLSYREIAEIVGKSEDNCKVIFSRVAGKMRAELLLILFIFKYLI